MTTSELPAFDERAVLPEHLSMDVFQWFCDAAIYASDRRDSGREIYDRLRVVLKSLALHSDGQSEAIRTAFGTLIDELMKQKGSDKICLDLTALLMRVIDSKRNLKYDPMTHLAVAGLGHLAKHIRNHMRQMAGNYFAVALGLLKVAPSYFPVYRETLLWTLTMSTTPAVDAAAARDAYKLARTYTADEKSGISLYAYQLLTALVVESQKAARDYLAKKADSLHTLYLKGLESPHHEVRDAAIELYSRVCYHYSTFAKVVEDQVAYYRTIDKHDKKHERVDREPSQRHIGTIRVIKRSIELQPSQSLAKELDTWLISKLLELDDFGARVLLIDLIATRLIVSEQGRLDLTQSLLRQLATEARPATVVLTCLRGMVTVLGDAVAPISDPIHQACLAILHSNLDKDEVWIGAIECLKTLVREIPQLVVRTMEDCFLRLESTPSQPTSYLLAVTLGLGASEPLYGSVVLNCRAVQLGINLVTRQEAERESYVVGWTLIAGAMALGPRVIKPIVPQLLLLWESHIPKLQEFPRHGVSALTGLLAFMVHNRALLTTDVTHRIGKVLSNMWPKVAERLADAPHMDPALSLKLLDCLNELASVERSDIYPSSLLTNYAALLTNADIYDTLPTKVVTYAAAKEAKVDCAMTSLLRVESPRQNGIDASVPGFDSDVGQYTAEASAINDASQLLHLSPRIRAPPTPTAIIDTAVTVVAKLLPLQPVRVQESLLDAFRTNMEVALRKKKGSRKYAVLANLTAIMWRLLAGDSVWEESRDPRVSQILSDLSVGLLSSPAGDIRRIAAKVCGVLTRTLADQEQVMSLLKSLSDKVVTDLDPVVRRSNLLAIGYINEQSPRNFVAPMMDELFKLYGTLAKDPDSLVHTAVLKSMRLTLSNAEPLKSPLVKQSLKIALNCYVLETHRSYQVRLEVARIMALVVTSWGPEISSKKSVLSTVLRLVDQFQRQTAQPECVALSWQCLQELYYYSRQSVTWPPIVAAWCDAIGDADAPAQIVNSAVSGLRMLFELSAPSILALAGPDLENKLWLLLNRSPYNDQLRELLTTWLSQTGPLEPEKWVNRLQAVVMRPQSYFVTPSSGSKSGKTNIAGATSGSAAGSTTGDDAAARPGAKPADAGRSEAKATPKDLGPGEEEDDERDEVADEDDSLGGHLESSVSEPLSWEARLFAIDLLLLLVRVEVVDQNSSTTRSISDIIKIAFSAATSTEAAMQIAGLALLNEIIQTYGGLKDPDFPHISLLEQYQVQITSAVTPAFGPDSTPGLALAALDTCGIFISSNIVQHSQKLVRIFKVLKDSLASLAQEGAESDGKQSSGFVLGGLEMSPNAARILEVGVLRVWAQVEIASQEPHREHLLEVLATVESSLPPLWVSVLKKYALLRFESGMSSPGASIEEAINQMEEEQLRQVVMPTYRHSWLDFVDALAVASSEKYDPEILFGLCLEALIRHQHRVEVLLVLKHVLEAHDGSGAALVLDSEGVFTETMTTLHRSMLSGTCAEQLMIVDIMKVLASRQKETDESVDSLVEILRVAMLPLHALFPEVFGLEVRAKPLGPEELSLAAYTLDVLIDIVQVFREVIQNDLWVSLLRVFEVIVGEQDFRVQAAVQRSFKRLLEAMVTAANMSESTRTLMQRSLKAMLKRALESNEERALHTCMLIVCANTDLGAQSSGGISKSGVISLDEIALFSKKCAHFLVNGESGESKIAAAQCIKTVVGNVAGNDSGVFVRGCLPELLVLAASTDIAVVPKIACDVILLYISRDARLLPLAITGLVSMAENEHWVSVQQREGYIRRVLLKLVNDSPVLFKASVQGMPEDDDRARLQSILIGQDAAENGDWGSDEDEMAAEIKLTSFA